MSRTGKGKRLYIMIPHRLYAAILQDIESRPRSVSVEHAVQECVRERYSKAKVKREYLVRAGSEVLNASDEHGEAAHLRIGSVHSTILDKDAMHDRLAALPRRERMLQRKMVRENFSKQLAMMTGGRH